MTIADTSTDQFRLLLGQPSVQDFMHFIKARTANSERCDDIALTRRWRTANALLKELSVSERGRSDMAELAPLPDSIAAEAEAALQDAAIQQALGFLPFSWAWVELDRLIVWQHFVETSFADRLQQLLPAAPEPADLLRVATGRVQEPPPVQVIAVNRNKFTFASVSTDMRILGAAPLDPKNVQGYQPHGYASSVIGVFVGYSINLMLAARMNNRLILTNGTHRAYALRALGITHAPCIVNHIGCSDDIDLLGLPTTRSVVEARLMMPRPPLLADLFDDRLSITIQAPRETQLVQLELKCEYARAPTPQGIM